MRGCGRISAHLPPLTEEITQRAYPGDGGRGWLSHKLQQMVSLNQFLILRSSITNSELAAIPVKNLDVAIVICNNAFRLSPT